MFDYRPDSDRDNARAAAILGRRVTQPESTKTPEPPKAPDIKDEIHAGLKAQAAAIGKLENDNARIRAKNDELRKLVEFGDERYSMDQATIRQLQRGEVMLERKLEASEAHRAILAEDNRALLAKLAQHRGLLPEELARLRDETPAPAGADGGVNLYLDPRELALQQRIAADIATQEARRKETDSRGIAEIIMGKACARSRSGRDTDAQRTLARSFNPYEGF